MTADESVAMRAAQKEQRARLGALSARDVYPATERTRLKRLAEGNLARLGWVSERDPPSSESVRAQLDNKSKEARKRLAWEPAERTRLSDDAKVAWAARCDKARATSGFVSPFLSHTTTSEHERTRLRDHHSDGQAYERGRLGFLQERTKTPKARQAELVGAKFIERSRLGWLEERTLATDAVRQREVSTKEVERSRLGWQEELGGPGALPSARRAACEEGCFESRSRLGMLVHSPRHPLAVDPVHRTVSHAELRATTKRDGDRLRGRAGMLSERTPSTEALRTHWGGLQREQRERLGMCAEGEKPVLKEGKRAATATATGAGIPSCRFPGREPAQSRRRVRV